MQTKDVLHKKDFFRRYELGEFGNRLRNWNSIDELLQTNNPPQFVNARSLNNAGTTIHDIPFTEIQDNSLLYQRRVFNEVAPDKHLIFQGEIYRNTEHFHLHYSLSKDKMRNALRDFPEKPKVGVDLLIYLKYYMLNQDYEWLMYLLDTYEDHTIEFGVYSRSLGLLGSHAIFWEVRKY